MSTHQIHVPALRGDDSLGFLASVGVLALSHLGSIPEVRLGWSDQNTASAVFESDELHDVDELGSAISDAFNELLADGAVLPKLPVELPLKKLGTAGGDPNRMTQAEAYELYSNAGVALLEEGDPWFGHWIASLYGQVITDKGRIKLLPLYGPFGQMSLRTSLYEKTMNAVEEVGGPQDALTGWLRTSVSEGYDGANLDLRAKRDTSVSTRGKAENQGAPSPTWLATMSPILMPIAEGSRRWGAVGWQAVRLRRDLTRRSLIWPIWSAPLDGYAIQALLSHEALRVFGIDDKAKVGKRPKATGSKLKGLGVRAVYGSSRATLSQGDGPLGAARLLWSQ